MKVSSTVQKIVCIEGANQIQPSQSEQTFLTLPILKTMIKNIMKSFLRYLKSRKGLPEKISFIYNKQQRSCLRIFYLEYNV